MISFVFNLSLALAWAALIGSFDLVNLILGFMIGAGIIAFTGHLWERQTYLVRVARIARLVAWAATEFVRAAMVSGLRALVPSPRRRTIERAEVPLSLDRDGEIAALAMLISATGHSVPSGLTADHGYLAVERTSGGPPAPAARTERKIERWLLECLR